jgi:hypothetical protein
MNLANPKIPSQLEENQPSTNSFTDANPKKLIVNYQLDILRHSLKNPITS